MMDKDIHVDHALITSSFMFKNPLGNKRVFYMDEFYDWNKSGKKKAGRINLYEMIQGIEREKEGGNVSIKEGKLSKSTAVNPVALLTKKNVKVYAEIDLLKVPFKLKRNIHIFIDEFSDYANQSMIKLMTQLESFKWMKR